MNTVSRYVCFLGVNLAALMLMCGVTLTADAVEWVIEPQIDAIATNNVFLDKSQQWDISLKPSIELGLDFADIWSAGYTGELNFFCNHTELLSHWHKLYLFVNPAWGTDSQNELVVELSVETLRNHNEYASINLLQPMVLATIRFEPASWFFWKLKSHVAYRRFYDDSFSDSIDVWTNAHASFKLPSRTTLTPRVGYGYRNYLHQQTSITSDDQDHQIEFGAHLAQALWRDAGLQLDYSYLLTIGENGMLERKTSLEQFSYLGEDFLYTGHRAMLGFKQLLGKSTTAGFSLLFEDRTYGGWAALDGSGAKTGTDRGDRRLVPRVFAEYIFSFGNKDEDSEGPQLGITLDYRFIKQWSNFYWYDTSAHIGSLSLSGSF